MYELSRLRFFFGVEKTRVGSVQLCCNVSEGRGSQQMGSMEECGNERFEATEEKYQLKWYHKTNVKFWLVFYVYF